MAKKFQFFFQVLSCFLVIINAGDSAPSGSEQPHIIFILADDLGWNDVGFHGSDQIPTPNLDALAYTGLILDRYYVTPLCTPSRSALMTGKLPIHTGMQHTVLYGAEPRGLPLTECLLPEYLRGLGYATHAVGKWHLGFYKDEYTPTHRGFDSHLGFWTGHHDYFDHTAVEKGWWGLDMRRNMDPAWDLHGQYSTDAFTERAVKVIKEHNTNVTGGGDRPLFLYIAHAAVHSGNPYNPLPVHDDVVKKFDNVKGYNRRKFAAMMHKLDESVGLVTDALREKGMLRDSIIVFSTDNGGPAAGFNLNAASNWPLRGVKNTLWEGGVRGAGFVWSPLINNGVGRVARQVFHISDWLPTLYSAAKGTKQWNNAVGEPVAVDGYDSWRALVEDTPTARTEVLHNIDDIYGNAALTVGDWKVMKGTTYQGAWDDWYGPSGRGKKLSYDASGVISSKAGKAVLSIGCPLTKDLIAQVRADAQVTCDTAAQGRQLEWSQLSSTEYSEEYSDEYGYVGYYRAAEQAAPCDLLKEPCLFNVRDDPCEKRNLAPYLPQKLGEMLHRLAEYNATAVPPSNLPIDPMGNPKLWQYTWSSFGNEAFPRGLNGLGGIHFSQDAR